MCEFIKFFMFDAVTNRRIVYYILGAVTSLKAGMAIHGFMNDPLGFPSLSIFLGLDIITLMFFYRFHTPRLTKLAFGLLIITLTAFSMGLFVWQSGQIFQVEDDLKLEEKPSESVDSILNTSHIIGSHTVHVRPPTLVKLNPNQTFYCIDNEHIIVPMLIKGTPPFFIDYTLRGDKLNRFSNITVDDTHAVFLEQNPVVSPYYEIDVNAKEKTGRKVATYGIKVSQTGIMQLDGAREQNGDSAKILFNEPVNIVQCPRAKWRLVEDTDKCIDDDIHASIEVEGIFPLSVYYVEQVGKDEKVTVIQGPEYASAGEEGSKNRIGVVDIPIQRKVDTSDVYNFKLARVVDGLNNTIQYLLETNSVLPPVTSKGMFLKKNELGDVLTVIGHGQPSVGFLNCESVTIRTEYDPQFESAPSVRIPLSFEGEGPFAGEVEFIPDNSMPAQPLSLGNINSKLAELTALEPGTFKLVSVKDRYCSGTVRMPTTCHVQGVDPPTFTFSASPIEESCFGAVGTNVDLSFTGEPPFWVEYVIEKTELVKDGSVPKMNRLPRERETFSKPRSSLILKPKDPGVYRYIFERVSKVHLGRR
jgi:nucleoporin POM152